MNEAKAALSPRQTGEIETRLPFFQENAHGIHETAQRLEDIADRIGSPLPCNVCDSGKEPNPESIIGKLDRATSDTQSAMNRLREITTRLSDLV